MIQIAHRGHSQFFEDNTKQAFIDAVDNKFDMIELDIILTKDNKIAVYHDIIINDKLVENLSFEELKKINKNIILLETFFQIINTETIKIYLDIKGSNRISPYLHNFLKNVNLKNIYLASFNTFILDNMQKLNKNYKIGLITDNLFEHKILNYYIDKYNLKFISFYWTMLNNHTIQFLHKKKISVFTYTCENNNILQYMNKFNIDGIVTNYKINKNILNKNNDKFKKKLSHKNK